MLHLVGTDEKNKFQGVVTAQNHHHRKKVELFSIVCSSSYHPNPRKCADSISCTFLSPPGRKHLNIISWLKTWNWVHVMSCSLVHLGTCLMLIKTPFNILSRLLRDTLCCENYLEFRIFSEFIPICLWCPSFDFILSTHSTHAPRRDVRSFIVLSLSL